VSRGSVTEREVAKVALRTILTDRKREMVTLARQSPTLFLTLVISDPDRLALELELQALVEKKVSIQGKIEVWHVDDFEYPENSRYNYGILQGEKRIDFYPTEQISLRSGAEVAVTAYLLENSAIADTAQIGNFSVVAVAPPIEATGDQKTLVLLVSFLDSPPDPFTKEQAYNLVFNDSAQALYKEQSYNRISFSGAVFGWFKLPRNGMLDIGCLYPQIGYEGDEAAELNDLVLQNVSDLSQYSRIVILPNHPCMGGASQVGKSSKFIGGQEYQMSGSYVGLYRFNESPPPNSDQPPFLNWTLFDYSLSHELGHALGLEHANGYDCPGGGFSPTVCLHKEYGNYFDNMGFMKQSLHVNGFYKYLWFKTSIALRRSYNSLVWQHEKGIWPVPKFPTPTAVNF